MIRKMMRMFLCLMLTLILPLAACADTQHTLTIIPGDESVSIQDEAVKDLLDVLSFTFTTGERSGAMTLTLDDTDIATVALGADETGVYVQSNLLGDDVFYTTWDETWDELFDTLNDALKSSVSAQAAANGEEIDEEMLEAVDATLDAYKMQVKAAIAAAAEGTPSKAQTSEEVLATVERMFGDDPGMVAFYENILGLMNFEEGEFADESRDTAGGKVSWVMTGKDIAPICDTKYMRSMVESIVKSEDNTLEEAELEAKIDETLEQIRKIYEESDMSISMDVFTTDEGETPVGMLMDMSMVVTEDDETAEVSMNMNYDRLTGENDVSHRAEMSMFVTTDDDIVRVSMDFGYDCVNVENGVSHTAEFIMRGKDSVKEELMEASFELVQGKDGVSDGSLALFADGTQITFVYHGENVENARQRSLALYSRENASTIIPPAASERPLITFALVSSEADTATLEAIEMATPETVVNVMKLSVEEVNEILSDVYVRVMQAMYLGMSKLPASFLRLMGQD